MVLIQSLAPYTLMILCSYSDQIRNHMNIFDITFHLFTHIYAHDFDSNFLLRHIFMTLSGCSDEIHTHIYAFDLVFHCFAFLIQTSCSHTCV